MKVGNTWANPQLYGFVRIAMLMCINCKTPPARRCIWVRTSYANILKSKMPPIPTWIVRSKREYPIGEGAEVHTVNEIINQQSELPITPQELSQFIIIGQETEKALRAEISAIKRLGLAKAVYDQKYEELNKVRSLMIRAYQRMGEISNEYPTASAGRPSKKIADTGDHNFQKSKKDALKDIGITQRQANRYEKIAAHPDVVDEVLSEAEAGQTEPTQAEVLRRIKEKESGNVTSFADARRKKCEAEDRKTAENYKNCKTFHKAVKIDNFISITDAVLDSLVTDEFTDTQYYIDMLSDAIQALTDIRTKLILKGAKHGKKNHHAGN